MLTAVREAQMNRLLERWRTPTSTRTVIEDLLKEALR